MIDPHRRQPREKKIISLTLAGCATVLARQGMHVLGTATIGTGNSVLNKWVFVWATVPKGGTIEPSVMRAGRQ